MFGAKNPASHLASAAKTLIDAQIGTNPANP